MGALFSRLRLIYHTLKSISDSFSVLSERISRDPGLPGPNPLAAPGPILKDADVVIIGSRIAGTAVLRTLLDSSGVPLRVVMLEARDVCSGATGRNGGHISPKTYQDYSEVAAKYGPSAAQAIIRFRLAHLSALLEVATKEGLLRESQACRVDQFDAYPQDKVYRRAKNALEGYLTACPKRRGKHVVSDDDKSALKAFSSFSRTRRAPISFSQSTEAVIATSQGILNAAHVVHAANAWASHLLPGMRRKIRPGRALAQATAGSPSWAGMCTFVFYPGTSTFAFDYLTQHPPTPAETAYDPSASEEGNIRTADAVYLAPAGELMFGGGAMLGGRAEATLMDGVGVMDGSQTDFEVTAYLGGTLERYFQPGWGEDGAVSETVMTQGNREWEAGRVKAAWSGIMGMSADGQSCVGRVPLCASRREEPRKPSPPPADAVNHSLAPPGEWIAAGFTGEGMTHAWLAGVALARMVLDKAD
ncbi:nucleotide-binding domain-containing protein [Mycena olivaceomarginata]|nr:nucleotide-binding domain-containing protein [Mycena olivaceomarginata]